MDKEASINIQDRTHYKTGMCVRKIGQIVEIQQLIDFNLIIYILTNLNEDFSNLKNNTFSSVYCFRLIIINY